MQIVFDPDYECYIYNGKENMPLRDFLRNERERQGLAIGTLQKMIGLTHPIYEQLVKGIQ